MQRRAALLGLLAAAPAARPSPPPSLYALRDWWLDDAGEPAQLQRWRGQPVIVSMEYSACRFICSANWRRLQQVQAEADRRGQEPQFVVLSIDPDNDTPATWRAYRREKGLQRRNWHFLSAARPATERAAAWLGVRWWMFDGHLMHDFKIVRLDADGRLAAAMSSFDEPPALLLDAAATRPAGALARPAGDPS